MPEVRAPLRRKATRNGTPSTGPGSYRGRGGSSRSRPRPPPSGDSSRSLAVLAESRVVVEPCGVDLGEGQGRPEDPGDLLCPAAPVSD